MSFKSTFAHPLLALAAVLVATPLAAREPVVVTGDAAQPLQQQQVDFADLDLRRSQARQTLVRRVMRASTDVCIRYEGRINIDKVMGGARNTCPNRTFAAARPQIAAAIGRAQRGERLSATSLIIAAPAMAR